MTLCPAAGPQHWSVTQFLWFYWWKSSQISLPSILSDTAWHQVHLISPQDYFINLIMFFQLLVLSPIHPPNQSQVSLPRHKSGQIILLLEGFSMVPHHRVASKLLGLSAPCSTVSILPTGLWAFAHCSFYFPTLPGLLSATLKLSLGYGHLESLFIFLHDPCDMCIPGPDKPGRLWLACSCGVKKFLYSLRPTVLKNKLDQIDLISTVGTGTASGHWRLCCSQGWEHTSKQKFLIIN